MECDNHTLRVTIGAGCDATFSITIYDSCGDKVACKTVENEADDCGCGSECCFSCGCGCGCDSDDATFNLPEGEYSIRVCSEKSNPRSYTKWTNLCKDRDIHFEFSNCC